MIMIEMVVLVLKTLGGMAVIYVIACLCALLLGFIFGLRKH